MKNCKVCKANKYKSMYITNELRRCPSCGALYYYDKAPIDWEKIKGKPKKTAKKRNTKKVPF